jgi:hypothetical protein
MMSCYFDESIEAWNDHQGKPRKFTFVCGYVASGAQWEAFELEWRRYLDRYDIQDFHLTDYCACARQYKKWKGKEFDPIRSKFMEDASEVIRKFARYGFVSAVSDSVFESINESYLVAESFGSPYGLLGRACADLAHFRRLKFYPNENEMEYIFEDGGPDRAGLIRAMTELRPAFPRPIFKAGKNSNPSSKYPEGRNASLQLQAADYLCYEVRKLFADQIKTTPVRGIRMSFKAVAKIPTSKKLFTNQELESLCMHLKIQKR